MNRYAAVFFGFIAIVIIAYFATRQTASSSAAERETGSGKQEVVVQKYSDADKSKVLKATSGDYYLGSDMAPVVLIEYGSMTCPHCAEFHEKVVERLMPTYIEGGKVKYVFRSYLRNNMDIEATKLAQCDGKDRFFSFLKVLFRTQNSWVLSLGNKELKKIAALGGIDEAGYKKCQEDKIAEERNLKIQKDAVDILGVNSTPTIFINGNQYKGKLNFDDVSSFIDKLLKGSE